MSQQDLSPRENFRFESQALGSETLHVLRFAGTEGLNLLYRFEIWLATQAQSLPLDMMLTEPARLTILRDDGNHSRFSGFLTHIEQTTSYNGWAFYKVILQPAFWKLTQIDQNNILVDKNVQETIDHLLNSIDYFDIDHEFRLQESYPQQEFSMQYNESIYDYLAWKMERDGIYYYFDEKDEGEHLVFADNPQAHTVLEHTPELAYSPTSGLENAAREETVSRFSLQVSPLPSQVVLRDYDWQKPNSPIIVSAEVSPRGLGKVYYYGEGFASQSEGQRLARIRAAALACTGRVFVGESNVPTLRPGHVFYLTRHYDDSFNRDYNIISVSHEGSQEAWLSQAIGVPIERSDKLYYRNSFTCIPADVQFRPERKTKRAKVSGMLTAFVDSSNDSGQPEIDDLGRYKVYFPQDNAGHGSGKASCWIRRMQNHVGKGHGMIFPLGPGVEVLVSFIDGDPDRPVIAGAVANGETGPAENANTSLTTGFSTDNGNSLVFNNNSGKQGLSLRSGGSSGIYMSSGSLDSMATFSNNSSSYFTAAQTCFAGLSSKLESSFSNSMRARKIDRSASAIIQLVLQTVSSLGTDVVGATKNQKAQTVWDFVNAALKTWNTVLAFKESAAAPVTSYGLRMATQDGDSLLSTSIYPSTANKTAYITLTTLELAAMLTKEILATGEDLKKIEDNKEAHKKLQRKTFAKIQREKKQQGMTPDEVAADDAQFIIQNLDSKDVDDIIKKYKSDGADQKIKDDYLKTHTEAEWEANKDAVLREKYLELFPSARNAALDKAYDKASENSEYDSYNDTENQLDVQQRIAKDDPNYFDNLETMNDDDLRWAKTQAVSKHVVSSVPALVAEILAMYALMNLNYKGVSADNFGGILLRTADKNVAIGSATESRLVSDKVVTIRALAGENKNIGDNLHTTIFDQIKGKIYKEGDGSHLLLTSENTYSGSFKNASFLAGKNLTIGAPEKISISTQKNTFDLIGKDYTIKNNGGLALPADCDNVYSTLNIMQKQAKLDCVDNNKQTSISAMPNSLDLSAMESQDNSGLTIQKDKFFAASKDIELTLSGKENSFEVKNGDTSFKLDAQNQKVSLAAKQGIDLNSDKKPFTVTCGDMNLNAEENVTINGKKIDLAGKITIDQSKVAVKSSTQLLIDGNMVKIC